MVIKGKVLRPMRGLIGVIEIEHHGRRGLLVTGHKVIHQGGRETIEVFAVYLVFQTGEGGRAGQGLLGVQGGPLDTECEEGSAAEAIGIVSVRIPRRNLLEAWGQQVAQWMVYVGLVALLMDRRCEARGQPNLAVDASQEEGTKVRRQGPTLAIRPDSLTGDRRKTQLFWARIGHKQTSCWFSRMDWTRILFYQRLTRGLSIFMKNSG
jgi:hypothetical protein